MANAKVHRRLGRVVLGLVVLGLAALGCATPGASPSTASVGGTPPASLAGHPLLGAWTVEVTKADLAAAGVSDPGAQGENSGRFTWTFAPDGTWTSVQESLDGSPVINPIFRGTFVVDDSTLIATTTFPAQYADAGLHYAWAVEGDELRLDLTDPPDAVLPVIVETHPWHRAG